MLGAPRPGRHARRRSARRCGHRLAQRAIAREALESRGERVLVVDEERRVGTRRERLFEPLRARGDDGDAGVDRLGRGDPVSLERRRHDENVGARERPRDALLVDLAFHDDALADPERSDGITHARDVRGIVRERELVRRRVSSFVMRHRLEKYPDDFGAYFEIGALRMARLDSAEALPMIEKAVGIRPQDPEARNLLGSALVAVGRNTEAIEQFRAAIRLRSDYGTARYNLARALVRAGKYDEAIQSFNQIVQQFPGDAQVRDELGELYLREGKRAQATEMFNQALAIDPKDAVARKDRTDAPGKEPETLPVPPLK